MASDGGPAIQDFYPDHLAHCYGCGRLNEHGYGLRTRWEGDEAVTRFTPGPFVTSFPGFVYGGLLASILDCHGTAVAASGLYRAEGREIDLDTPPVHRCVTGTLTVRFERPTPLGPELEVRGVIDVVSGRKVHVLSRVVVNGAVTVRAEMVAFDLPEGLAGPGSASAG